MKTSIGVIENDKTGIIIDALTSLNRFFQEYKCNTRLLFEFFGELS